jgi:regulatory protein YycH of two-component signal transduction system YycFG
MMNPLFFDSTDLFSHMFSPRERVYVVSDSQYKAAQKAQAERQIQTLEARAADYQRNLDVVQATITELKTEHGLLPAAKEEAPN